MIVKTQRCNASFQIKKKSKWLTHASVQPVNCHKMVIETPAGGVGTKRKRPIASAKKAPVNQTTNEADDTVGVTKSSTSVDCVNSSRIASGEVPAALSIDRLRNFVLFKAYDVIGSGGYRRFVLKNKNNGEAWATTLYNDTQYVSRHVRTTLLLVNRLQYTASCVKLHKLCQRVINDLNPPTISTQGWCICALTGCFISNKP